jgi:hypothetical protein
MEECHVTRFAAPAHEALFCLSQSVALAAGIIVYAVVLQLLPDSGVEDDTGRQLDGRRTASAFVPGPQASPIVPEMALCNVNADSPIAPCVTYGLPGSLSPEAHLR